MKRVLLHLSILGGFVLYCFVIEQANSPIAGAWATVTIERFGPMKTVAGRGFNLQPNGSSALWLKTAGQLGKNFKVVWQRTVLETVVKPKENLVTAVVPDRLFASPGIREVYLVDSETGERSEKVLFEVVGVGDER